MKIKYDLDELRQLIEKDLRRVMLSEVLGEVQIQFICNETGLSGVEVSTSGEIKPTSRQYSKKPDAVRQRRYRVRKAIQHQNGDYDGKDKL